MRPLDSVTGTRWTRWTPLSNFSRDQAPSPSMRTLHSFTPPSSVSFSSTVSVFQPRAAAYMVYIRSSDAANSAASSPPVPARISRITFFRSLGSLGSSRSFSSCRSRSISSRAAVSSSWANSRISGSESSSSAAARSASACRYAWYASATGVRSFSSRFTVFSRSASP